MELTAGQTFTRTRRAYIDGQWTDSEVHIRVTRLVENYKDWWTGETHTQGVEFRMIDSANGVSHVSLPLEMFLKTWA